MGIKNLKALGIYVLTNTVINSLNFKDLPALARLFVRLNVNQFQFAFVHIIGRAWDNRFRLVPKKSQCVPYVKKGLEIGRDAGIPCYTEAIPYCFMNGFEDFISEKIIPDGPVVDDDVLVKSFQVYRQSYGKIKGPPCRKCLCRKVCEGPWKEYTEIYGWEEFNPVTAKQSCR